MQTAPLPRPRPLTHRLTLFFATAFGLGYAPKAPGTFGTLLAIPVWLLLSPLPPWAFVAAVLAVTAFAVLVSHRAERIYGGHDVQHIVIDEVAGMLFAVVGVPFAWPEVLAAFLLFRLFDMTKPPPIGWIDKRVGGGLGVVADDVVAGIFAGVVLHGARFVLGGWW